MRKEVLVVAKKKREQKSSGTEWSGKIRFKEDRAPDRGHAQSTSASVPIIGVHEQYQFIEIYPGCFRKSYWIGNNNYLTAPEEEQMTVYKGWQTVLNSFGNDMEASLTVYNQCHLVKLIGSVQYEPLTKILIISNL